MDGGREKSCRLSQTTVTLRNLAWDCAASIVFVADLLPQGARARGNALDARKQGDLQNLKHSILAAG